MPRFYYEYDELEVGEGETPECIYIIYDRKLSNREFARCERGDDAEKIVDALNAAKAPSLGIFG